MDVLAAALVIVVPLGLLVHLALALIRTGMNSPGLTDAARQRFVGCGVLLAYPAAAGLVVAMILGCIWLGQLLKANR